MTVGYSDKVATCRGHGNFWKMLFKWKGSIYKVVWLEMIVYMILYYIINTVYRIIISKDCEKKKLFIQLVRYCDQSAGVIPLSFILSFYVGIVVDRWWKQWMDLPWPDTVALSVASTVSGRDDRARLIRRTIVRYTNLAFVMTLCLISTAGKFRFPSLTHLVTAGFMQEHEKDIVDEMNLATNHPKYWVPIVWAGSICRRARKEGKVRDDISLNTLINALNRFRRGCQQMLNYDWVNIPLVYTQAVTMAVYLYFLATLIGKQVTIISDSSSDETVDLYLPFFSFCEFFFYVGWLKVAECLINPYGLDDDDFEVNWIIDRDFTVSYIIVDDMHDEHPNLLKDQYWDEKVPFDLPYTESTVKYKSTENQMGSTKYVDVPPEKAEFVKHFVEPDDKKSLKSMSHTAFMKGKDPSGESVRTGFPKFSGSSAGGHGHHVHSNIGAIGSSHTKPPSLTTSDDKDDSDDSDSSQPGVVRAAKADRKRFRKGKEGGTASVEDNSLKALMEKEDVIYKPSEDEN